MKVRVDNAACQGHGRCYAFAPDVFESDDEGRCVWLRALANAAIPAALTGASVVASDLAPELFESGRRLAAERGAELEWQQADAEDLPFGNDEFDTVLSCAGVMFAPHHRASADELVRVCRPGGTIGLLSWTLEGFIGQMFATMKPYAAPPPPGAQPPPLWGSEDHVCALLGDRVTQARGVSRLLQGQLRPEGGEQQVLPVYGAVATNRGDSRVRRDGGQARRTRSESSAMFLYTAIVGP